MLKRSGQFFSSERQQETNIVYFKNSYPPSHWAQHLPVIGDKNYIATLDIHGIRIALKLNATDSRGYRAIAGLVTDQEETMSSTFNRNYTVEEKFALNTALCILSSAYENYGLIAQTEIAGNNSQSVTESGAIQLGNEKEPSLLHGHIIGRGNPNHNYIGNVPLRGPMAGAMFNMRADGLDKGNESKTKWENNQMEVVSEALANEVSNVLEASPNLQNVILISSRNQNTTKFESS